MEYLIPAALVVLLVAGFVTFVAMYSTRKGGPGELDRNASDSGDARPGMGADSASPLGDTDQLADQPGSDSPEPSGRFDRDGEAERDRRPESERLADRGF
jgi:hypothetical protein